MRISKFQFEDKSLEWRLEEIQFNKLTLLVGASGVGKTQILRALMALKSISQGNSLNGVSWKIEFESLDGKNYIWEGEFEKQLTPIFFLSDVTETNIIYEKLICNGEVILERDSENIFLRGKKTPKLFQNKSIVFLLQNEEQIKPILDNLMSIKYINYSGFSDLKNEFLLHQITQLIPFFVSNFNKLSAELKTLKDIQESDLDVNIKLFFLSKIDKKTMNKLKQRFMSIFPTVEDLKIDFVKDNSDSIPDIFKKFPFLQMKEKGVKTWIGQNKMSSGMYNIIMQLSELYLCAEGSVFLIDEFENSLGINCINEITNDILVSNRDLQFILTSHHPYIIDSIGFKNWKLVTRNAGVIKTHNLDKFNIGNSKHSSFMQLLQLEEYQTGQEQL